jgi:hypothetical protein
MNEIFNNFFQQKKINYFLYIEWKKADFFMIFYKKFKMGVFFIQTKFSKVVTKFYNIFVRLKLLGESKINNELLLLCHKD